ncbi:hypothetical protein ACFX5K_01180 [Rickettsiales bacterium LUAb2]
MKSKVLVDDKGYKMTLHYIDDGKPFYSLMITNINVIVSNPRFTHITNDRFVGLDSCIFTPDIDTHIIKQIKQTIESKELENETTNC